MAKIVLHLPDRPGVVDLCLAFSVASSFEDDLKLRRTISFSDSLSVVPGDCVNIYPHDSKDADGKLPF